MKLIFDENIADDQVECWGISVPLLKSTLFSEDRNERFRIISEKIERAISEFDEIFKPINPERIYVSLASAWTRYYVFLVKAVGKISKKFALHVLSPDSTIRSFDDVVKNIQDVITTFPSNIAKPIAYSKEFMLQEWVDGTPLSEFRDGDILRDVEDAKKCIPLVSEILYKLNELGYVYYPWDDYELIFNGATIIFLDLTRFVKKRLSPSKFFDFYFGVPFTPPEIIKPSKNPAHRLYWRGVSEKDYFGTSKEEYIKLFLSGIAKVCKSFEEFTEICNGYIDDAESTWRLYRI